MSSLLLVLVVQTALPPLPDLKLDSFPVSAREAITRAHRDAASHPGSVEHVGALARTLHAWEQWEAARQTYERLQRLDARGFDWPYLEGVVLQRLARHADAAARFQRALALEPEYLPARVKLAEALLESGALDESHSRFAALTKEPAAEPVAEYGLGRIAAARGRHDEAIVHLERAVSLFPEFGAAHYALARSYRASGRAAEAKRALALNQQYGARWPAIDDEVVAQVASLKEGPRAQIQRGATLADRGDIPGAIAAHEAALAADPGLADAHANLISLYGRARDWTKAERHYRAAVTGGVNLADAHYDYGVVLGLQEKWDLAAEAYAKAIAANQQHAAARNNLGQILERSRRLEEAAAEYRRAVEARPGFRLARFNLGRMLIALGRPADAVSELEKLTEPRDAESPRYLFALSVAHLRAGRKDEAISWGEEAKRLAVAFGQPDLAAAIERDLARVR
jgi:tetratricopeptide (TPR) repeat protein